MDAEVCRQCRSRRLAENADIMDAMLRPAGCPLRTEDLLGCTVEQELAERLKRAPLPSAPE